jgi:hypothetical protein
MRCILALVVLAGVSTVASLSQQAPAPARPPTPPLSAADLQAVPLAPPHSGARVTKTLFDGRSLAGWRGNPDWWSVADGAIVGKAADKVPTSFLFTADKYSDFRLTLLSRMVESENHAGVCFWSDPTEKGNNQWYTNGPLVVFPKPGMWDYREAQGIRVFKSAPGYVASQHDWVKVEILVQGNRVRSAFNGIQVMEWRQADPALVREAPIGLQLHAWNGPQEVRYKDVVVETFPREDRLITLKD